jgi:hypothetical protein
MAGKWSQFSEDEKDKLLDSLESGLYNHPVVGPQVKEAVEQAFGFTDPELAASRRHKKEIDELREQLQASESKTLEKEIRSRVDSEKKQAQDKYKLGDDDMKEVSKLMVESGIGNYDKAADYYRLSKQAAKPTSDHIVDHSAMTLPGDVGLYKNPVKWAREEAYKTINEIERNRG